MSETTRLHDHDTFTFMHALELVRRCFLPILVAVILTNIPSVFSMLIEWEGRTAAAAAEEAALAEYLPEAEDFAAQRAAQSLADDAYAEAYQPYKVAAACVELVVWLYAPWMILGLYRGLLEALRGGECRLRCLFSAVARWKTALWLAILTGLCTAAASIAGTILMAGLSAVLSIVGVIIGFITFVVGMYWVSLRLLAAEGCLADDDTEDCTAMDCIRFSWREMKEYGVFSALYVLWPVYLLTEVASLLADRLTPLPALDVILLLVEMLCLAVGYAATAGIYEEIRRHAAGKPADDAVSEGLARARALAAGESAD